MENKGEVDKVKEDKVEENQGEADKEDEQWKNNKEEEKKFPMMHDGKT